MCSTTDKKLSFVRLKLARDGERDGEPPDLQLRGTPLLVLVIIHAESGWRRPVAALA